MVFHKDKHITNPSASKYERGMAPGDAFEPMSDYAQDAARREMRKLVVSKLREGLSTAAGVIGTDTEWGPARRRPGTPTKDEIDEIAHYSSDFGQDGHGD